MHMGQTRRFDATFVLILCPKRLEANARRLREPVSDHLYGTKHTCDIPAQVSTGKWPVDDDCTSNHLK